MIVKPSTLRFPDAPGGPIEVRVVPLTHCFVAVGTGYGMDADWRHGMWQGPLVVQGREWSMEELASWGWFGIVDHAARFELSGPDSAAARGRRVLEDLFDIAETEEVDPERVHMALAEHARDDAVNDADDRSQLSSI